MVQLIPKGFSEVAKALSVVSLNAFLQSHSGITVPQSPASRPITPGAKFESEQPTSSCVMRELGGEGAADISSAQSTTAYNNADDNIVDQINQRGRFIDGYIIDSTIRLAYHLLRP